MASLRCDRSKGLALVMMGRPVEARASHIQERWSAAAASEARVRLARIGDLVNSTHNAQKVFPVACSLQYVCSI